MKKQILKIAALLVFTAVAFSSCSVSYRERHAHGHHDDHDHHYEEVHHY